MDRLLLNDSSLHVVAVVVLTVWVFCSTFRTLVVVAPWLTAAGQGPATCHLPAAGTSRSDLKSTPWPDPKSHNDDDDDDDDVQTK